MASKMSPRLGAGMKYECHPWIKENLSQNESPKMSETDSKVTLPTVCSNGTFIEEVRLFIAG